MSQITCIYALAPLPYATGLLPLLFADEIDIEFLPPVKEAMNMSFKERNIQGFKLGMKKGIEYFFGLGSVLYYVSQGLTSMQEGERKGLWGKLRSVSPTTMGRYLVAKRKCREEHRQLLPKDLFQLKCFMCAGTDNRCYKDDLEKLWGIRPMEILAGTEPTCIGCRPGAGRVCTFSRTPVSMNSSRSGRWRRTWRIRRINLLRYFGTKWWPAVCMRLC